MVDRIQFDADGNVVDKDIEVEINAGDNPIDAPSRVVDVTSLNASLAQASDEISGGPQKRAAALEETRVAADEFVDRIDRFQVLTDSGEQLDKADLKKMQTDLIDMRMVYASNGGDPDAGFLVELREAISRISARSAMNR